MPERKRLQLCYELTMEAGSENAEIMVYSRITSYKWREDDPAVTASDFDKLLKQAKANGAKRLNIRINSPGGAVYQAVAMRTMLLTADFESINVAIEGLCASAATLLCCVPNSQVSMAEGSSFMIHNPHSGVLGTAQDMFREAQNLQKCEEDMRGINAKRCNQTDDKIKQWMDDETWFTAKEAKEAGFVDSIIGEEPVAASIDPDMYAMMCDIYAHIPESVSALEEEAETEEVSPTEPSTPGKVTENKNETEEDHMGVEIKDITMEQLRAENPALIEAAIQAERERVAKIDKLTPAGYEALAEKAKKDGLSPTDFVEKLVEAQSKKGETFMSGRKKETEKSAEIEGGHEGENDDDSEEAEMEAFEADVKKLAAQTQGKSNGMY